jgi:hypothetical protein
MKEVPVLVLVLVLVLEVASFSPLVRDEQN